MPHRWLLLAVTAIAAGGLYPALGADKPASPAPPPLPTGPRLVLPPWIPAVPGVECNLYFANVVLTPRISDFLFDVDCAKGEQQAERWTFTPKAEDVGSYPLTLTVRNTDFKVVATGTTTVRVVPADAGSDKTVRLLIIGDSLTNASQYPERILQACSGPGNPTLELLGTHHLDGFSPGNRHEGYGGWTYQRFVTLFSEQQWDKEGRRSCSPFVFMENGKPTFDFPRYVREQCGGRAPDFVTVALGCNDTFGATDDTIDAEIDKAFGYADQLIAGIHAAGPETQIGLVLLVPPSASQDAFGANYKTGQTRYQYRRNQHRVVERMLEKYGKREQEGIFLVPCYVNLDCVHNYPGAETPANAYSTVKVWRASNGVHPAKEGYFQMGDVIYCWMKMLLAGQK